jgi:hypothetical protein
MRRSLGKKTTSSDMRRNEIRLLRLPLAEINFGVTRGH